MPAYKNFWKNPAVTDYPAESIVEKLNNLGLWISYGDVEQFGHGRVVSRSHIASALESRGYVQTKKEAFEKYLAPQAPLM